MSRKRDVLSMLWKDLLVGFADAYDVSDAKRMSKSELVDALMKVRRLRVADLLEPLDVGSLRILCGGLELGATGGKQALIERLVRTDGVDGTPEASADPGAPRVINIRQPWIHAIIELGKDIENRTWETRYRGPVFIHASKSVTRKSLIEGFDWMRENRLLPYAEPELDPGKYECGGIVAMAELADCLWRPETAVGVGWSQWHLPGFFGFRLANVRKIPFMACGGKLGLYKAPPEMAKYLT